MFVQREGEEEARKRLRRADGPTRATWSAAMAGRAVAKERAARAVAKERPIPDKRPPAVPARAAEHRHPLLNLQRTAGNRAVSALVGGASRRRHTEDIQWHAATDVVRLARAAAGLAVQRDGPDKPPPDLVARPTQTELETAAQGYIGDWYAAALAGLGVFEQIVADDIDWSQFWLGVAGNLLWATACFATGPAGAAMATAGKQFAISLAGIALNAKATANQVSTKSDFHKKAVKEHIEPVRKELNDQVKEVSGDVSTKAAAENWNDNRTRTELIQRMMRPQYFAIYKGGLPNVDQNAISQVMVRDLAIEANELGQAKNPQFGEWSTGSVTYRYDVSGALDDDVSWYEFYSVKQVRHWGFNLRKVELSLPTGGRRAVEAVAEAGKIEPATMKMRKRVILSAVGKGSIFQDDTFEIILDHKNDVYMTRPDGFFLHGMNDPDAWARTALRKAWSSSGGLPPPVTKFDAA